MYRRMTPAGRGLILWVLFACITMLACNVPILLETESMMQRVAVVDERPTATAKVSIVEVTATPTPLMTIEPTAEPTAPRVIFDDQARDVERPAPPRIDFSSTRPAPLADTWPWEVTRWNHEIQNAARRYGLDPDLLAAVILAESAGNETAVSYVGAVGLMGIMSSDVGFRGRPSQSELLDPMTNVNWGGAILADILAKTGGDLHIALAAYNGGWEQVDIKITTDYAEQIMHWYGRAVASRNGVDPNSAERWTIAIEMRRGNVGTSSLLLHEESADDLTLIGEHLILANALVPNGGNYVLGYAVPLDAEPYTSR